MDRLNELIEKQAGLTEDIMVLENKLKLAQNQLASNEDLVKEIKLKRDTASFKYVRSKMTDIIEKIASKHKIPKDREVTIPADNNVNVVAAIPYTTDKNCTDENPFNVAVCPRCALIHFREIIDRTIAEYYS